MGFRELGGLRDVCKNCQDRYPACHDACKKYIEAKTEFESLKAKVKSARNEYISYGLYKRDVISRTKKS